MVNDWMNWQWNNVPKASCGGDLFEIMKAEREAAMARDQLCSTMTEVVEEIRLLDTHEHIADERFRLAESLDFTYLMPHYLSSDLVSAGMPLDELEAIRAPGRAMRDAFRSGIYTRDPGYPFPERLPDQPPSLWKNGADLRRFGPVCVIPAMPAAS